MKRWIVAAAACASVNFASGMDFSAADALFAKRGEGFKTSTKARDAYFQLQKDAKGQDLVYAVVQASRLDLYRGCLLYTSDAADE